MNKSKIFALFFSKQNKKGQVTIFIIIGIFILMAFGLYVFSTPAKYQPVEPVQFNSIQLYLDNCGRKVLKDAVEWNGNQGGYYNAPNNSIFWFSNVYQVPLYYYQNKNYVPDLFVFEKETNKYVNENLKKSCNFTIFLEQGFSIKQKGPIKTKTKLTDLGFVMSLSYPLETNLGNSYWETGEVEVNYPVKLKKIHRAAKKIVEDRKNNGLLCLNCLEDLKYQEFYDNREGYSYMTIFDKDYKFTFALDKANESTWKEWEDEI